MPFWTEPYPQVEQMGLEKEPYLRGEQMGRAEPWAEPWAE